MKIKVLNPVASKYGTIPAGKILEARHLPNGSLFPINSPYQVTDKEFSGTIIKRECAMQLEENAHSENDMENHYKDLLEKEQIKKEQAQGLAKNLGNQLLKRNKEIEKLEYFVTSLTLSLKLSSEYVIELRKQLQK